MKKILSFISILSFLSIPTHVFSASLASRLSGNILLQVEQNGEAWYLYPEDYKRYFLNRPEDAFQIMRSLGLGIQNIDIAKIPVADGYNNPEDEILSSESIQKETEVSSDILPFQADDSILHTVATSEEKITSTTESDSVKSLVPVEVGEEVSHYDKALQERLSGMILLQVEKKGEAWYVSPENKKRYYLGRPADAFRIMSQLGLGITDEDLAQIRRADEILNTSLYDYSIKKLSTEAGDFWVRILEIHRDHGVVTSVATAEGKDCYDDCKTHSLYQYTHNDTNVFAAINGGYFCPDDYPACASETNVTLWPIYSDNFDTFLNERKINFTEGPLLAMSDDGGLYYFHRTREIQNKEWFEFQTGEKLTGAISSGPSLIEFGESVVGKEPMDNLQKNRLAARMAFGYNDKSIYIVYASAARVPDMAAIMKTLGTHFALNLDGGQSSALMLNNMYYIGPGRNIPNAILFKKNL